MRRTARAAVIVGGAVVAAGAVSRLRRENLEGKVVFITGASRGLGLGMAEEFARHGARLAICARDAEALERARRRIEVLGGETVAVAADVARREEVERAIADVTERFGRIDILVNNAGIMTVGPLGAQTLRDFEDAMGVMFWGVVYPTLAVIPQMRARRSGTIVNITSIGGKVSAPHLLPYSSAKFAAVGFSEGLRAELAKDGIRVVTVVPGFMRTGSHLNASYKGDHGAEHTWMSLAASMPGVSMNGRRAARRIVDAARRGTAELMITPPAHLAARAVGLFPGTVSRAAAIVNRLLPRGEDPRATKGTDSSTALSRSWLTRLGEQGAREFAQLSGPGDDAPDRRIQRRRLD